MSINMTKYKKFGIDMKEQFLEPIEAFGENIDEKVTIPASIPLFIFEEQAQQLDNNRYWQSYYKL